MKIIAQMFLNFTVRNSKSIIIARFSNCHYIGRFLDKPMKEIVTNSLVGLEIFGWFIVGEMIGRKSLIGYKV